MIITIISKVLQIIGVRTLGLKDTIFLKFDGLIMIKINNLFDD